MYTEEEKTRMCYMAAAVAVVLLLLIVFYMWREHSKKNLMSFSGFTGQVPDNPGNPQPYEYNNFLAAYAKLKGPQTGCYAVDGLGAPDREHMSNTFHWDQMGTYQHTADTWGLPVGAPGDSRVNYSQFSKENMAKEGMSVGAHWDQMGTYGHTGATLPDYGLSGYYEDVPTSTWA